MEETKKKSNYGFLFAILKVLGIIVLVVALVLGGLYFYIRVILGVDIFGAINLVKKLGNDFEVSTIVDDPYSTTDIDNAFLQFDNAGLAGFYTKNGEDYTINEDISTLPQASQDIAFSSKQLAGFLHTFIESSLNVDGGDIGDIQLDVKQIKISNYQELANGPKVDMNIVLHTSIKELKATINIFPLSLLTKYLPEDIYIGVNFSITKTGELTYTIDPISMKVNGLSEKDTAALLNIVIKVIGGGDVYLLTNDIGKIVMQALVSGENGEPGITQELSVVGIADYTFENRQDGIYFVMKR